MTISYQITRDSEFSGLTAYIDDEPYTVASTHPAYTAIVGLLLDEVDDSEKLLGLINPGIEAGRVLTSLSERVAFRGGSIYFDGDVIESAIADHIVSIFENGGAEEDWKPLVLFLEKLSTNPSKKSRKHLYHFIEEHGMAISETGMLIAYKGVSADGESINAGYGIVDGAIFGKIDDDGRVIEAAHLPNKIGSVIEIPRSLVDDDRAVGCSTGLHVGSHDYATWFAQGKLLRVAVNPRDVVSVPSDSNNAKVRVSRYVVLEENETKITTPSYFTGLSDEDDFDEAGDEFDDDTAMTDPAGDDDDEELSDEQIEFNAKVDGFIDLIPTLDQNKLRNHRNKKVTAKNRLAFDEALHQLGL